MIRNDFAFDALEQAPGVYDTDQPLVRHNDHSVQYSCIRYTERLAEAGIASSVDTLEDFYVNAPAETIIELFETEEIC